MTGRKLKLLGEDRREQQQYIDSGAETLTSAAGYFSGRIQELGEKVECMQGHMDVERELRHLRVLADCILLDVRGRCGEQRYQSALNNLHDRLDWGLSPAWAELRYYAEFVIDYAEDFQELAEEHGGAYHHQQMACSHGSGRGRGAHLRLGIRALATAPTGYYFEAQLPILHLHASSTRSQVPGGVSFTT